MDHEGELHPEGEDATVSVRRSRRRRWWLLGGLMVVVGAAGWTFGLPLLQDQAHRSVVYEVPQVPRLTAASGERLFRIDPTASSLTYAIRERFVGESDGVARGTTNGIAGDLVLVPDDLSASRIGLIAANVEQLHSDNNLRDARLRHEYLDSSTHPLALFDVDHIEGLDGTLEVGRSADFTLSGSATVRDVTRPITFEATAELHDDGSLHASATATTTLSEFGIGPISIAGLLSTDDRVELTLALTAWEPSKHTIPTRITGPDAKTPEGGPSYRREVEPILESRCASCHNTGGMASAHTRLDTAADAQGISDGIATVTKHGFMPPWPASSAGVPLAHDLRLTEEQIATLAAWSRAGGPLDVAGSARLRPTKEVAATLPRRDLVLERPAYTGDTALLNDYRCFVLDPALSEPMYLTGYTFLADQIPELHHAQVFHISAEQLADARTRDGGDGRPGWSCYGGTHLAGPSPSTVPGRSPREDRGAPGQSGLIAGWVPGQAPVVFPMGAGVFLQPGEALVLQIHYHYDAAATADRSTVALQLDPADTRRKVLRIVNPLAPVELPCAPEDRAAPLCDRAASLADYQVRYPGAGEEAGLLRLCRTTAEELAARSDGTTARTSCDSRVPEDGTIVGVLGHEHTLGATFRMTLDPDAPRPTVLLDIPDWSFDWQMNYQLRTPIHVTKGQTVRIECSFDRRRDPDRAPRWIMFAEGTEDEMCFGTYSLIPDRQE